MNRQSYISPLSQAYASSKPEADLDRTTRVFLVILFVYSCFSGAVRKWVVSGGAAQSIILGIQLLLPFSFFILIKKSGLPLKPVLIFFICLLVVLALNPMNLTIYHGLFGILTHLGPWIFVFYYLDNYRSVRIEKLINFFSIVAVIEITIGFIQYNLPTTHFLNKYSNEEIITSIAAIGEAVRITGTFSYLGGYSAFLLFLPLMLWAMVRLSYPMYRILLLYAGGLVACFMNGGRAGAYVFLLVGFFIVCYQLSQKYVAKFITGLLSFGVVLFFLINIFSSKFQQAVGQIDAAYENFDDRRSYNVETGEEKFRIITPVTETIFFRGKYPLVGVGLGATYQGATITWGTSKYALDYEGGYEEEAERVIIEGGFVLFFVRIFLLYYFYRKSAIPRIPMLVFMFLTTYYIPVVFNTYNGFFWFLGLCLLDRVYRKDVNVVPAEK